MRHTIGRLVPRPRPPVGPRGGLLWLGLAAVGGIALLALEYPEIQRYLKMRAM